MPGDKRGGYTLVEMVIVIVLLLAIGAVSIGAFVQFYQTSLVDDTSRTLKDMLRRARAQAMAQRNNAAWGVRVVTTTDMVVLFEGNSYATRDVPEDESFELPGDVIVSSTVYEVVFSRLYGTSTASTTWQITNGGVSDVILINSAGLIQLQ